MYGYIYKTTNLINEKIYIGQHKGKTIDNKYFGSGILIKRSLKKYGKENFKCELIDNADNKSDLDSKEIYWIEKLDSRNIEIGYNIVSGGNGGNLISSLPKDRYDKFIKKIKVNNSEKNNPNYKNGSKISGDKNPSKRPEVRKKLSESLSGDKNPMFGKFGKDNPQYGYKRTDEQKENIRKAMKDLKYKKHCAKCGISFLGNSARSKYCSEECKKRQYRDNLII